MVEFPHFFRRPEAALNRVPGYLKESPDVRQEREVKYLVQSVERSIDALAESGELDRLNGDALTRKVGDIGNTLVLDMIGEKYDAPEEPELALAYHNRAHTEGVLKRFGRLVDAANRAHPDLISMLERVEGELESVTHDFELVFEEGAIGTRKRKPVEGEQRSALRLTAIKQAFNAALQKHGKPPIFEIDSLKDTGAIAVTIPTIDKDLGVIQGNLNEQTPLRNRFLGLADLGDYGMDGPEKLLASGKQIAIEENSDIIKHIRMGTVPTTREEEFRTRLLGFVQAQPSFADSRRVRFPRELDGIEDPAVKAAITGEFKYFSDKEHKKALEWLTQEADNAKKLSYEQLVQYIGIPEFIRSSTPREAYQAA